MTNAIPRSMIPGQHFNSATPITANSTRETTPAAEKPSIKARKIEVVNSKDISRDYLTAKQKKYLGIALTVASIALSAIPMLGQISLAIRIYIFVVSYILFTEGSRLYDKGSENESRFLLRDIKPIHPQSPLIPKLLKISGIALIVLSQLSPFIGLIPLISNVSFELSLAAKWGIWSGSYLAYFTGKSMVKKASKLQDKQIIRALNEQNKLEAKKAVEIRKALEQQQTLKVATLASEPVADAAPVPIPIPIPQPTRVVSVVVVDDEPAPRKSLCNLSNLVNRIKTAFTKSTAPVLVPST